MPNWKPFIIPPTLIVTPALPFSSAPFLLLPTEILLLIFDQAGSLDKLCLALSCRHLLQVSALASLHVPFKCKHRGCCQEKLLKRLRPVDMRGKPKRSWRLCCDCMQYRPTKKSYWNKKLVTQRFEEAWGGAVRHWNTNYSLQCPQCWEVEALGRCM
ncbi:hypothetical protein BU26DRAFT_525294 [Trematosphaeria pertusa]|uniref:F-box domain-containing protein n=1 Tax=Trematosphaeria pertusa TaxID=390896 RepID=A0A6A6HTF7_9PLEO|nr:uncharacterized protein BU26DRAFT_525294 [Trematosphaeria pertusa]KAF2241474.1 hypothetical protein BU26DRAFT_525294 [Trematosphaeria pertusa]